MKQLTILTTNDMKTPNKHQRAKTEAVKQVLNAWFNQQSVHTQQTLSRFVHKP
jgi:hypothetical protein